MSDRPTLVLFLNDFFGTYPYVDPAAAAAVPAEFTTDMARMDEADAVVFHLPTFWGLDGVRKRPGQLWVAFSMESRVTTPELADERFMAHFDLTATYRRSADVWMPYVGQGSLPALLSPPAPKTGAFPVAHFQSNPFDRSGRNEYAAELMKRVKVASYGRMLPTMPDAGEIGGRDARLELSGRHKFTLAFENTIAEDYVTDKFFDALIAGSVPVYLGAPNVADFAPAPNAFIDVADFDGPADLARHLNRLDRDDAAYADLLAWKRVGPDAAFLALLDEVHPQGFCRVAELVRERSPA